ncbi:uncharacterized protein GGS25DRAFT_383308 [Hypoxylon fragiforme]|uniref:uncharacterized protein n=1 Tax=Hypoxylon fragiforme TaxID=63214 RepID=UPI0020C6C12A|nr:uncharacterized protein GGS25DRAFT_383308 [Hypoxylon fragiforme]KAI2606295.1 hypothetical protein GGS25DRAFT_383308 [Hypoxylon fragiforme]
MRKGIFGIRGGCILGLWAAGYASQVRNAIYLPTYIRTRYLAAYLYIARTTECSETRILWLGLLILNSSEQGKRLSAIVNI